LKFSVGLTAPLANGSIYPRITSCHSLGR